MSVVSQACRALSQKFYSLWRESPSQFDNLPLTMIIEMLYATNKIDQTHHQSLIGRIRVLIKNGTLVTTEMLRQVLGPIGDHVHPEQNPSSLHVSVAKELICGSVPFSPCISTKCASDANKEHPLVKKHMEWASTSNNRDHLSPLPFDFVPAFERLDLLQTNSDLELFNRRAEHVRRTAPREQFTMVFEATGHRIQGGVISLMLGFVGRHILLNCEQVEAVPEEAVSYLKPTCSINDE